jgi:hypothetical protein
VDELRVRPARAARVAAAGHRPGRHRCLHHGVPARAGRRGARTGRRPSRARGSPGRWWRAPSPGGGDGAWGAAVLLGVLHVTAWGGFAAEALDGAVILVLAGVTVGHVARWPSRRGSGCNGRSRSRRHPGAGAPAGGIHDSVLQVLARSSAAGPSWAATRPSWQARAATRRRSCGTGALRAARRDGRVDMRGCWGSTHGGRVACRPAHPVWLPRDAARLVRRGAALSTWPALRARARAPGCSPSRTRTPSRSPSGTTARDPRRPGSRGGRAGAVGVAQSTAAASATRRPRGDHLRTRPGHRGRAPRPRREAALGAASGRDGSSVGHIVAAWCG